MKQLLILSGKGGTGKTTVCGAFINLAQAKAYADCDVDAPNLHLITKQNTEPIQTTYYGLDKAKIDTELCIKCDQCRENCRFDAISATNEYHVDPFACEGCGVCREICPVNAVSLYPTPAGKLMMYADKDQVFSTAKLNMGSGTSGKLVAEVKRNLKNAANYGEIAFIDGSPGIGCPVIASISGVNLVLIVAEPSISGISDMERIIKTAATFQTKTAVCINKYDTNPANAQRIQAYCRNNNLPFVGQIPFDTKAIDAVNNGQSIVEIECPSGQAVKEIYQNTMSLLLK